MGSSVNDTNIEISTAAVTVMPNWWKKRPMMPPMKPTGRNTATIEKVVASTASPISAVPSRAAALCVLYFPCTFMPAWRTMFSRTTIASSISRPTQSDSAISVIMLIVKPKMYMNRKVPMIATGSVRPVITVERQEFRNRNTITIVSTAPSIIVRRTLSTPVRIWRELSWITPSFTPGYSACRRGSSSLIAAFMPSATSIVFWPCAFSTASASVRSPLYSARLSCSSCPSTTVAICDSSTGWPPRRATMMRPKSCGSFTLPWICTTFSSEEERIAPLGNSWFSLRSALITWSIPMPSASISPGFT